MRIMAELGKLNKRVREVVRQYAIQCYDYWKTIPEIDVRPEEREKHQLNFVLKKLFWS